MTSVPTPTSDSIRELIDCCGTALDSFRTLHSQLRIIIEIRNKKNSNDAASVVTTLSQVHLSQSSTENMKCIELVIEDSIIRIEELYKSAQALLNERFNFDSRIKK